MPVVCLPYEEAGSEMLRENGCIKHKGMQFQTMYVAHRSLVE